jgi:hypothetical protein
VDTLKLAWKVATFYDLTPQTLARLTQTYGLRESGGLVNTDGGEGVPLAFRQRIAQGMTSEVDPRVRYCLWHQLMVTRRAQVLRERGYQARVQGWLVVVRGGKPTRIAARRGQPARRIGHPRFGRSE